MASRLNPYLNFNGNAREAMEFYAGVLGGNLTVTTFADLGQTGPEADKVMHAQLETDDGYTIMAADHPASQGEYHAPVGFAMSIFGDEADKLRGFWDKLGDGGRIDMPLAKQPWGDEFGIAVDKFGICWMVDIGQPQP
jgi:PhnB protein